MQYPCQMIHISYDTIAAHVFCDYPGIRVYYTTLLQFCSVADRGHASGMADNTAWVFGCQWQQVHRCKSTAQSYLSQNSTRQPECLFPTLGGAYL